MDLASGRERPEPVLRLLAGAAPGRLQSIFYKRGASGGLVWHGGASTLWRARADSVIDPTGAGDAFAGGVLASSLRGEDLIGQLRRGVVSASFALEGVGADGLLAARPASAEDRLHSWYPRSA